MNKWNCINFTDFTTWFFNIDSHDLPLWRITARYQLSSINSWISQVQCHTYVTGNWFIIDYVTAWIIGFFLIQLLKFKKIHWKPCRAQRRPFSQRIIEWISFIYSGAGIRLPTNYIGEKSWWRHQKETLSASLVPYEGNPPVRNGWVNNQDNGDLRRHPAHSNVTAMYT